MHFSYDWIRITFKCLTEHVSMQGKAWAIWHHSFQARLDRLHRCFKHRNPTGTHKEFGETSAPSPGWFQPQVMPCNPRLPYLKVGIVVVRMLRFPHLHCHPWLLHELTGCQGHGPQHALLAPMQHFLENLGRRNLMWIQFTVKRTFITVMLMADVSHVQTYSILEEGIKAPARNKINSQMMPTSVISTSTKDFTLPSVLDLSFFIW